MHHNLEFRFELAGAKGEDAGSNPGIFLLYRKNLTLFWNKYYAVTHAIIIDKIVKLLYYALQHTLSRVTFCLVMVLMNIKQDHLSPKPKYVNY